MRSEVTSTSVAGAVARPFSAWSSDASPGVRDEVEGRRYANDTVKWYTAPARTAVMLRTKS